jgi:ERCC4-type nuclease
MTSITNTHAHAHDYQPPVRTRGGAQHMMLVSKTNSADFCDLTRSDDDDDDENTDNGGKSETVSDNEGVVVLVDHRERDVWRELDSSTWLKGRAKKATLPFGDVWIMAGGFTPGHGAAPTFDAERCIMVLERKTLPDLKASICQDGRYLAQREALLTRVPSGRAGYILECGAAWTSYASPPILPDMPAKVVPGFIVNNTLRGLRIVMTRDPRDTAHYVAMVAERVAADPAGAAANLTMVHGPDHVHRGQDDDAVLTVTRKRLRSHDDGLTAVLASVGGVRKEAIRGMVERYKTVAGMVAALERVEPTARTKMLSNGTKELGKKGAARVVEALFGKAGV